MDALLRPTDPYSAAPYYSLRHRLHRASFAVTWLLLARWTPPMFRRWRNLLLRLFGAKLHASANIYASARIWYPPNLSMDAQATLGPGVICYNPAIIHLGPRAIVSQRAHLCAASHDPDDPGFPLRATPIHIAGEAWVAAEAFVGPGVTLARGAVLGARGVAFGDLAPWTIHAGNPARPIRERRR